METEATEVSYEILYGILKFTHERTWDAIDEGIDITSDLRLRRLKDSEKEKITALYPDMKFSSFEPLILEHIPRKGFQYNDFNPMKKGLLAFRLLKEGDIFLKDVYVFNDHRGFVNRVYETLDPRPISGYRLEPDDIPEFLNLFKKISKIDFNKESGFRISCDRFDRYFKNIRTEDMLIDLCISFEALFFMDVQNRRRLTSAGTIIGLACSMLIGKTRQERNRIKTDIEEIFSLRNKIAHGNIPSSKNTYNLLRKAEKHLRQSLQKLLYG